MFIWVNGNLLLAKSLRALTMNFLPPPLLYGPWKKEIGITTFSQMTNKYFQLNSKAVLDSIEMDVEVVVEVGGWQAAKPE